MAGSLRDQLVKAGLATSVQAKKAERQQRVESQSQRRNDQKSGATQPATATTKAKQRGEKLKAEKVARDRALAGERNKKYAARALRAEIKQIILSNDQRGKTTTDADVPYNFVHGKKIKKIYVPTAQKDLLISGSLVIVNNDGLYHFVSKDVSEQIASRDPKRIIVAHDGEADVPSEDDEYYAKFAVPDDLDW